MEPIWSYVSSIVLSIILGVVGNYIYDNIPKNLISRVIYVILAAVLVLGIIWGMWSDKIPVLLGENLIFALGVCIVLIYFKASIRLIIGAIVTGVGIRGISSGMSAETIPVLTGINSIVLLLVFMFVILIWDFVSYVWDVIKSTDHKLVKFISIYQDNLTRQSELNRRNLTLLANIVDKFYEAINRSADLQNEGPTLI